MFGAQANSEPLIAGVIFDAVGMRRRSSNDRNCLIGPIDMVANNYVAAPIRQDRSAAALTCGERPNCLNATRGSRCLDYFMIADRYWNESMSVAYAVCLEYLISTSAPVPKTVIGSQHSESSLRSALQPFAANDRKEPKL